jgi:hypothetical protein
MCSLFNGRIRKSQKRSKDLSDGRDEPMDLLESGSEPTQRMNLAGNMDSQEFPQPSKPGRCLNFLVLERVSLACKRRSFEARVGRVALRDF